MKARNEIKIALAIGFAIFAGVSASEGAETRDSFQVGVLAGYHSYLSSNYLKAADEYFETDDFDGPNIEGQFTWKVFDFLGLQSAAYFNEKSHTETRRSAEMMVKYKTVGLTQSVLFYFFPKKTVGFHTGGGIDVCVHQSTLEIESHGETIAAGHEEEFGFGLHWKAGLDVRLSDHWRLIVEDRLSYIPIVHYAGSSETFDVGGNFLQIGLEAGF